MAKKFAAWWSAHKPTTRRLIQVYAALLYNAYVKGFIKGDIYTGSIKNFCVPGFELLLLSGRDWRMSAGGAAKRAGLLG